MKKESFNFYRIFLIGTFLISNFLSPSVRPFSEWKNSLRRMKQTPSLSVIGQRLIALKAGQNDLMLKEYLGEEVSKEKEEVEQALREFFLDDEIYQYIKQRYEQSQGLEKRRFKMLKVYFDFMRISLEPETMELQEKIFEKRRHWNSYIKEHLPPLAEQSPQEHEETARILRKLGREVEPWMGELIKLRNKKARELGYQGWMDLRFKLNEIEKHKFDKLFYALKNSELIELFSRIGERELEDSGLEKIYFVGQASNYKLIKSFVERLPEEGLLASILEFLKSIGLGIPEGEGSPIEIIESEKIPFIAYDFLMKPGRNGKSVIIVNRKIINYFPMGILHEFGHAIHDYHISDRLPPELTRWEGMYSAFSETMAQTFEFFFADKSWLRNFFLIEDKDGGMRRLTPQEIDELSQADTMKELYDILYFMMVYELEKNLYENPDQDFEALYDRLMIEYGRTKFFPSYSWAQHIPFFAGIDESMYYQNYVLSYLVAAQVVNTIKKRFGQVYGNPEIGKFLIEELYQFGMSRPWQEVVESATGKELSIDDFIEIFVKPLEEKP